MPSATRLEMWSIRRRSQVLALVILFSVASLRQFSYRAAICAGAGGELGGSCHAGQLLTPRLGVIQPSVPWRGCQAGPAGHTRVSCWLQQQGRRRGLGPHLPCRLVCAAGEAVCGAPGRQHRRSSLLTGPAGAAHSRGRRVQQGAPAPASPALPGRHLHVLVLLLQDPHASERGTSCPELAAGRFARGLLRAALQQTCPSPASGPDHRRIAGSERRVHTRRRRETVHGRFQQASGAREAACGRRRQQQVCRHRCDRPDRCSLT